MRKQIVSQAESASAVSDQPSQSQAPTSFRPDIEGLRAVAVLAVVLFHAKIPGIGGGFVGVDVFFVISGFLITGLLWREAQLTGTVRLRSFYGARARRLLPASAFVGVFILIASAAILPTLQARTAIWDGITSALYVSNYRFILQDVDYMHASAMPSPFQHYWSLGVEEQFYLVWPAVLLGTAWFLRRFFQRTRTEATASPRPYLMALTGITLASFALSLALTYWLAPVAFFSLPTRAWQLAVGGLIALSASRWRRLPVRAAVLMGWLGLAGVVATCTLYSEATPYPGAAAVVPTLGAALIIAAGCSTPDHGVGRMLGLGPMRFVGRISYSWYLWHWPVLLMVFWGYVPALGHPLAFGVAGVLFSAGLATLTWRFVENPLRFTPRIRTSAGRSLALGGVATAVAVCTGLALIVVTPLPVGRGAPASPLSFTAVASLPAGSTVAAYGAAVEQAVAQVQTAIAASADLKSVPSNLGPPLADPASGEFGVADGCLRTFYEVGHPECASGDVDSTTTVALLGDSNAAMWSPAFGRISEQRGWRLETLTRGLCPFLDLPPIIDPTSGRPYDECARWRGQILERLLVERPKLVVVAMMRQYGARYGWKMDFTAYDETWLESLKETVRQIRQIGSQVLVVGSIPIPPSPVPECLAMHLDDASACAVNTSEAVDTSGIAAERAAVELAGGQYADVTDLFCSPANCPAIVGDTLVYMDSWHTTEQYSLALAPALGAITDLALARTLRGNP